MRLENRELPEASRRQIWFRLKSLNCFVPRLQKILFDVTLRLADNLRRYGKLGMA